MTNAGNTRNARKIAALAMLAGALTLAAAPASAQHRHSHGPRVSFGFHFGAPIGWYYAPPPVYYHPRPRVVVIPAEPTVYVERELPAAAPVAPAAPDSYWYYCGESRAYYPYVRDCPGGWERVPPRPQP